MTYEPPKSLSDLGISARRAALLSDEQLTGLVEQAQQRDRQRHAELLLHAQGAAQDEILRSAPRKAPTPSRPTPKPSVTAQATAQPRPQPVPARSEVRVDLSKPRVPSSLSDDLYDAARYIAAHPEAAPRTEGGRPWRTSV